MKTANKKRKLINPSEIPLSLNEGALSFGSGVGQLASPAAYRGFVTELRTSPGRTGPSVFVIFSMAPEPIETGFWK
jgi:hypothetical protein